MCELSSAVAGYSLYRPEVDDDSVDLGIASRGNIGSIRSPRLELHTNQHQQMSLIITLSATPSN
jgi:hypothetical protein